MHTGWMGCPGSLGCRNTWDARDTRMRWSPWDGRAAWDTRGARDATGTQDGQDAWDARDTRDGRDARGVRDAQEVPEMHRRCPGCTGGVQDTRDAQEVSGMHRRCPVCGCLARPRASVARAVAVPLTFTNQLSPSAHPLPSLAVLSPWRLRNLCSLVNGISANETPTPPSLPLPAPGEILASHLHPHPLLPLGIKGTSPC